MDIIQLWLTPPDSIAHIIVIILGALGAILMLYGILLEKEKNQDAIFALGSFGLLLYAISLPNLIFTIAMAAFFLTSCIEWYQIHTGQHRHIKK